jgi:hypothetical protein
MNYSEFFAHLRSNNSRLFKEAEVMSRKDDLLLRDIFIAGLDPYTNYWIRKIPDYKISEFGGSDCYDLRMALDGLKVLSSREKTGHAGIAHLKNLLENMEENWMPEIIEYIINGDFRCNVSDTIVNKVWPGAIKSHPVMLATASDEKLLAKLVFPQAVQLKLDGMRMNAIIENGKVLFTSRAGRPYDFLGNLENEYLAMEDNCVYDGEAWVDDGTGKPMPRKKGNGIITKAYKGTISEAEASMIRMTIWDKIPIEEWRKGKYDVSYRARYNSMMADLPIPRSPADKIFPIALYYVDSIEEVNRMFVEALQEGEEGVMLKDPEAGWEDKRVKHQLKFKAERDADMLCVGWEFGTGKNVHKVGNLILETSDGLIRCSLGTGFSDKDREIPGDYYVGKIIEIVYNERIKSEGSDTESLFLPRFICVREDKTVANSSEELK